MLRLRLRYGPNGRITVIATALVGPDKPDASGRTALFYAQLNGHAEIVALLQSKGWSPMPTSNVFEGPGGRKMFWTDPKGAGAQAAAKPVASPSGGGVAPTIAKRKLKKAFCEPGNADANPPLALGAALVESGLVAALAVARAPENGGDARYGADDLDRLVADVAAARLHPGDLKPAVAAALRESVLAASAAAADYPDAKKDAACLKALAKKLARAKKSS